MRGFLAFDKICEKKKKNKGKALSLMYGMPVAYNF